MSELIKVIADLSGQNANLVPMPDLAGNLLSYFGWLPGAPLTRDQWLMLQRDNIPSGKVPGLEAFDVRPTPLAAVAYEWLDRFRGNRFAGRRIHLTASN
jgi:NADH dehydrogenase